MIRIKANLKLYKRGRTVPIRTGYRPLFEFVSQSRISGQIELINNQTLNPGSEDDVIISFINKEFLGISFKTGAKSFIYEGREPLGEVRVLEIIENCD